MADLGLPDRGGEHGGRQHHGGGVVGEEHRHHRRRPRRSAGTAGFGDRFAGVHGSAAPPPSRTALPRRAVLGQSSIMPDQEQVDVGALGRRRARASAGEGRRPQHEEGRALPGSPTPLPASLNGRSDHTGRRHRQRSTQMARFSGHERRHLGSHTRMRQAGCAVGSDPIGAVLIFFRTRRRRRVCRIAREKPRSKGRRDPRAKLPRMRKAALEADGLGDGSRPAPG